MRARTPIAATVACGVAFAMASAAGDGRARADDADDAARKLADLEQKIRQLGDEVKEPPPPSPDMADRRVIDAQTLFGLKNYDDAATICLDVVEKWPQSRAAEDATFLLGESLYQLRDLYSARRYFEKAIEGFRGTKRQQEAVQRLVEIALRTGDYEHVEDHLAKLDRVPPGSLEPSVPYVKAKFFYFRDRLDDAAPLFNSLAPGNPYYFQARYFLATILVRKDDLASATVAYDAILKQQAPDDAAKDIQDLSRMALGRILYDRGQFDAAVHEAYERIPRQSKYFSDALFEQGWTFIKAKDFQKAYRAFDLLLLANPDATQAPELKLLMGNLHLLQGSYFLASEAFSKTRDEFEPVHKQLQGVLGKSQTEPNFFQSLVGKNFDKFDITLFIPQAAVKWVRADPEVQRVLTLTGDVVDIGKAVKDANRTVDRIERAIASAGRVGIFPDLARARRHSIEILDELVKVRRKLVDKVRKLEEPHMTAEDKKALDRLSVERDQIEREMANMSFSAETSKDASRKKAAPYEALDNIASELNVQIQAMEAQVVALESYYRATKGEQKIAEEDVMNPVRQMHTELEEMRTELDKRRDEIADAARDAAVNSAAGEEERATASRLDAVLKQEEEIQTRVRPRLPGEDQEAVGRAAEVMRRADAVETALFDFDQRVDTQAEKRLVTIRTTLDAEKEDLRAEGAKLGGVTSESQDLGGGLAQAMFARVADRFYDLVVRSDVGLIDVSWGLKDQKTQAVSKLVTQQKAEIKALDEDFKKLQEDAKP